LREIVTPGIGRKDIERKAGDVKVSKKHFERAIRRVKPTTSREALTNYEQTEELFARYATEFEDETSEPEKEKETKQKAEANNVPGFFQAE
jgi:transitional endoplasmic reticulum ATPase